MAHDDPLGALRARFARDAMVWARAGGIGNPRVEAAFAAVPRERFLTPAPWRIFAPGSLSHEETSDPARLYADVLVVLDAAKGINNGQPSLHAAWMAGIDPRPGEAVTQVGVGAGYYTAILAELVGPGGRVEAYEIDPRLAALAQANLAAIPQVTVHAASAAGIVLPDTNVVYVAAGAAAPEAHWIRALRDGGRLVMPWQPAPGHGRTLVVRRTGDRYRVRLHGDVTFVRCVGAAARPRGLPTRPVEETQALWLTEAREPDESATAIYDEVWFSASP